MYVEIGTTRSKISKNVTHLEEIILEEISERFIIRDVPPSVVVQVQSGQEQH